MAHARGCLFSIIEISTYISTPSFHYPKISTHLPNKHISMIPSAHSHLLWINVSMLKKLLKISINACLFLSVALSSVIASDLPACPSDVLYWNNCFGTFTYTNGGKYVGEFKNNKFYGQGTFTYANGPIYSDGDKYVGEWRDNFKNGQGTLTFANGNKYVGEFKDGNFHGQGTFTYANNI